MTEQPMNDQHKKREQQGAIWVNKSAAGNIILKFSIGGVEYIAFENKQKTSDRHPTYHIYLNERKTPQNG